MTEHAMAAHLRLSAGNPLIIPSLQDALARAQLAPTREERAKLTRALIHVVERPLIAVTGMLGYKTMNADAMEVLEYMMRGGIIGGGSQLGDYAEAQIMKHFFRNTAIVTTPTSVDVHLYTTATSDVNSSGTEVTGGAYAAQNVNTNAGGWSDPGSTGGATDNAAAIAYPTATANLGTISHASIEMPSAANRLFHGALTASKTVNSGDTYQFNIGDLDVSLA